MNETLAVQRLLDHYPLDADGRKRAQERARTWLTRDVGGTKADMVSEALSGLDLGTAEGRALMELAESYLRIPSAKTRAQLLKDKLGAAHWKPEPQANRTTSLARFAAGLGKAVLKTPLAVIAGPIAGVATEQGMAKLARHFVMGETISEALSVAKCKKRDREWHSYDVLGEGARSYAASEGYFQSYLEAIRLVGADEGGISVKLSALHPKFEETHRAVCFDDMVGKLTVLCVEAAKTNMTLMVDAEEERRLTLSLDIIEAVRAKPELQGWNGFGAAVQAYLKRTPETIERLETMAARHDCTFHVRLVKGAYWDSEIKYAQAMGHDEFPVFTQKAYTDLSYVVCAGLLLRAPHLRAAFGSHNALSLASAAEIAGGHTDAFDTQRLVGMGDHIHEAMREEGYTIGVYAPVGPHHDLLPYLVRRLLENGANTSFLKTAGSGQIEKSLRDPYDRVLDSTQSPHPAIRHPLALYPGRPNSAGPHLGDPRILRHILDTAKRAVPVVTPKDTAMDQIDTLVMKARRAYPAWNATPVSDRAALLYKLADRLEAERDALIGLLQDEAAKTLPDAIAEIREAVDFCRYYATQAQIVFAPQSLPGPDGERNTYSRHGKGVFVCIAPWNFPLAIFLGQTVAALVAGNTVLAKPAEQTPRIGAYAVRLAHDIGIPKDVLHCVQGNGTVGAALTGHDEVSGVAFTGSYEVGKIIQRALAVKEGPIATYIAETAGLNAMAVDATALPEQVVDDVVLSAFGSAGQRCSALRILLIEEEAAGKVLPLLSGAMAALRLGDPKDPATDVGPLIDREAAMNVHTAVAELKTRGQILYACTYNGDDPRFVPPIAIDMTGNDLPDAEIFGPVLQIYRVTDMMDAVRALNARGYALTFGIHTRLPSREAELTKLAEAGNIYVNRSMIGAVVGVQPFGGHGRSGTGPKAGGPQALLAYSVEKHVSVNTAAAGGNASLVALEDAV